MELQEAIRLIHPDTSKEEIWKHPYYGDKNRMIGVINQAISIVCDAAQKQIPASEKELK